MFWLLQTPSLAASKPSSVGSTVAQHQEGKRLEDKGKLLRAGCTARSRLGLAVLAGARGPGWGSQSRLGLAVLAGLSPLYFLLALCFVLIGHSFFNTGEL